MRAKALPVIERCIEQGMIYGLNRAYKHSEPTKEYIGDCIQDAIMGEIYEAFCFEDHEVYE